MNKLILYSSLALAVMAVTMMPATASASSFKHNEAKAVQVHLKGHHSPQPKHRASHSRAPVARPAPQARHHAYGGHPAHGRHPVHGRHPGKGKHQPKYRHTYRPAPHHHHHHYHQPRKDSGLQVRILYDLHL